MIDYLEVENLLNELAESSLLESLNINFSSLLSYFFIEKFCILIFFSTIREEGEMAYYTTYPADWVGHYKENLYHIDDPVMKKGLKTYKSFSWDMKSFGALTNKQEEIFHQAKKFDIHNGTTIPVCYGHGDRAILTLLNFVNLDPTVKYILGLGAQIFSQNVRRMKRLPLGSMPALDLGKAHFLTLRA